MSTKEVLYRVTDDEAYGACYTVVVTEAEQLVDVNSYWVTVHNHEGQLLIKVRVSQSYFDWGYTHGDVAIAVLDELETSWALDNATRAGVRSLNLCVRSLNNEEVL